MTVTVVCADGKVRHQEPFPNKGAAVRWAWWGHCCLATHTYQTNQGGENDDDA